MIILKLDDGTIIDMFDTAKELKEHIKITLEEIKKQDDLLTIGEISNKFYEQLSLYLELTGEQLEIR